MREAGVYCSCGSKCRHWVGSDDKGPYKKALCLSCRQVATFQKDALGMIVMTLSPQKEMFV